MNANLSQLYKPTYQEMKVPMSSFEAAMLVAGLPKGTPHREARKDGRVYRLQKKIQRAGRIYNDAKMPDAYRLEHGIPSAWDGGCLVFERAQVERWHKRRFTKSKRSRFLAPDKTVEG